MYPKVKIDLSKLKKNLEVVSEITCDEGGCSLAIVTKSVCAEPEVVNMICQNPKVEFVADSRMQNISRSVDVVHENGKKTMLLRIPMISEIPDVIRYVDLCQISEIETIRVLNEEAGKAGKVQDILLMMDMGDLREGFFFQDREIIHEAVREIVDMGNVRLYGIGVNLTCYGAIIPKPENLNGLVEIAKEIEVMHGIKLNMVSGGNSSSIYLIPKKEMPEGITNLRLGEAFILGNETAYGERIPGTYNDGFILEAEIVELKSKPSLPIGEVGLDAFGQKPFFEDRGRMDRAIIAVGKQDVDLDSMMPLDERIEIMGGSSDHIILDVSKCQGAYKVGDKVEFVLNYVGVLRTMTSAYITKEYI